MDRKPPPPNYDVGLARSAESRTGRSKEHQARAWALIAGFAWGLVPGRVVYDPSNRAASAKTRTTPPRTLEQYAARLNEAGSRTSRGLLWTGSTVHRVFQQHGMTPKRLREAMVPQPFLPTPKVPKTGREVEALAPYSGTENRFGRWVAAVAHPPCKGDLVRLRATSRGYAGGTVFRVRQRQKGLVAVRHDVLLFDETLNLTNLDRWVRKSPGKLQDATPDILDYRF